MEVDEFLEHHGVKGMHWGVRKDRRVHRPSGDSRTVSELRKRPKSSLTNKQLQTVNTRLDLEQRFSKHNPTTAAKGKQHLATLVGTGTLLVTAASLLSSKPGQALIKAGRSALSKRSRNKEALALQLLSKHMK